MPDIRYRIAPANPNVHLFHVELEIDQPDASGQSLSLPNWIPGSYLIRDFSKHLIDLQAETQNGEALPITPVEKSHWQVAPHNGPIKVQYDVYAWDLSVRGAHFDQTHAFFNGTSVFLAVDDQRDQACSVEIVPSPYSEAENWRVATTLPPENVNEHGFGLYRLGLIRPWRAFRPNPRFLQRHLGVSGGG